MYHDLRALLVGLCVRSYTAIAPCVYAHTQSRSAPVAAAWAPTVGAQAGRPAHRPRGPQLVTRDEAIAARRAVVDRRLTGMIDDS